MVGVMVFGGMTVTAGVGEGVSMAGPLIILFLTTLNPAAETRMIQGRLTDRYIPMRIWRKVWELVGVGWFRD